MIHKSRGKSWNLTLALKSHRIWCWPWKMHFAWKSYWKLVMKAVEAIWRSLIFSIYDYHVFLTMIFNTLRPRQHGCHFADDTFKRIFLNENVIISIKISLKLVPKGPINNIPALVQIMAWRRPGDKPLSEAMTVSLLTHINVTRPQWVKWVAIRTLANIFDAFHVFDS